MRPLVQTQKEAPVGLPGNKMNNNTAVRALFTLTILNKVIVATAGTRPHPGKVEECSHGIDNPAKSSIR